MGNIKLEKATLTIHKENGSIEEIDLSNAKIIKIEEKGKTRFTSSTLAAFFLFSEP